MSNPKPANGHRLLTPAETAEILGVSPRTLDGWRRRGCGPPFVRLTQRTLRYRRADLDKHIARSVRANTAAEGPPPGAV